MANMMHIRTSLERPHADPQGDLIVATQELHELAIGEMDEDLLIELEFRHDSIGGLLAACRAASLS